MPIAKHKPANTVIVFDFETTGLSPDQGDRAIEIGAVRIENGVLVDRFQSLMNPGRRINAFIEDYTGITNAMLKTAPPCTEVMAEFSDFVGRSDLVAHNAAFDKRFLLAELARIQRRYSGEFACSLLAARRIYKTAANHKLGTLVEFNRIANDGTFHRALADAEMTALLWLKMLNDIEARHGITDISLGLMQKIASTPKKSVDTFLRKWALKASC